jgi:hypothetical protein
MLPMRVERYSTAIKKFHDTLIKLFEKRWKQRGVNLGMTVLFLFSFCITNNIYFYFLLFLFKKRIRRRRRRRRKLAGKFTKKVCTFLWCVCVGEKRL